ncbi:MAG: hypothetical protein HY867_05990 [Chloroflexi bacterium]|nr:hypothetical protein [Chloroflexota bacterium]
MTINSRLAIAMIALFITTLACGRLSTSAAPVSPISHPFDYYGWVYVFYDETHNDLARISSYTNTAFATSPEQVKILASFGFEQIIYILNEQAALEIMYANAGQSMPDDGDAFHEQIIPDYREKFFEAYRQYLTQTKDLLTEADVYSRIDLFYIADEPALHRNVYVDQDFLNQYAGEFKSVFTEKKSTIAFAAIDDPQVVSARPQSGPHFDPPPSLDVVTVDPYFYDFSGEVDVPCERAAIQKWLYQDNPLSNINWAKQFHKPIIVVGDAEIRGGRSAKDCHIKGTYALLKDDPAIAGLVWFIYDKKYAEANYILGAANDPHLVEIIENLGGK